MDAPFLYIVRFWIHPDGHDAVMGWLEGGHMKEVVSQPGFLWVRRVKLDANAAGGWTSHLMIYGLTSRAALQAYFDSPAPARFAKERAPFAHHLRMERDVGVIDFQIP